MAAEWFYREGSQEVGPVPIGQLRLMLLEHRLTTETPVCSGVGSGWRRAVDVAELAEAARANFRSYAAMHWRATRGHWAIPAMLALLVVPVFSLLKPVVGWWGLLGLFLLCVGLTVALQLLYRMNRRLAYAVDGGQFRPGTRSLTALLCFAGYVLLLPVAAVVGVEYFTEESGLVASAVKGLGADPDQPLAWSKDFFGIRGNAKNGPAEPPGDPSKGRRWAVIVGINNYFDPKIIKLKYAVADARLMYNNLTQFCGYDEKNVLLLTDDADKDHLKPGRSNLKMQISKWLQLQSRDDTVLVFFSGHGFFDKGKSYLAPLDCELTNPVGTCWLTSDLRAMLEDCKACQKLLILDCCHAGGKAAGSNSASPAELGGSFRGARGLITLASCDKAESSFEYDDKKQGLFTFFLAEGMRGEADKPPYGDGNGIVDSDELYKYTYERVTTTGQKEKNLSQTPVRLMEGVAGTFALAKVAHESVKFAAGPDGNAAAVNPPTTPQRPLITPPTTPQRPVTQPTPPVRNDNAVKQPAITPAGDVLKSTIGMELRKIPAGTFQMGSPSAEHPGSDEELHAVTITHAFYMGVSEVTQDEYVRVTKKPNPSFFSAGGGGRDKVAGLNTNPFPVEMVSHADAEEFCRLLNQLDKYKLPAGWEYRLPTEAEWEYACRANTTTPYHWGETLSARQANFGAFPFGGAEPGLELIGTRTMPVRSFPSAKNAFGLYDMHGNVAEWCADFFTRGFYKNSPPTDPTGPASGTSCVVRGGSWSDGVGGCRSASRTGLAADDMRAYVGFRVVCAPPR
jgi:formylglycine-generating enzyme required for sulfatase activity